MSSFVAAVVAAAGLAVSAVGKGASARIDGPDGLHPAAGPMRADRDGKAALWVFFLDKGFATPRDEAAALARLAETYPARAVDRRRLRRTSPGLFDARDLAVSPGYVAAVLATGVTRRIESRWLNAVSVRATAEQAAAIASLPFVRRVEPVAARRRPAVEPFPAGPAPEGFYGRS